jgi:hypothetical protein
MSGGDTGNPGPADNRIRWLIHEFENFALSSSQFGSTKMDPSGKTMVGTLL